jgi:phage portal protein BeeE
MVRHGLAVEKAPPKVRAAGQVKLLPTVALGPTGWGTGMARLAPFDFAPPETVMWDRSAAMSVPTISRARDLICSAVGSLPLALYRLRWDQDRPVEEAIPPLLWFSRIDPNRTRQWMLSWTTDDLMFYGRSYWRITARYATSYPSAFERMPVTEVHVTDQGDVRWNGHYVEPSDVIEFLAPTDGILYVGYRAIAAALALDMAAERFAACEVPAGWLKQTGGEPMSPEELTEIAAQFTAARRTNTTAALNEVIDYHESSYDPERLQLTVARQHQALELARLANVPPYLVGAPAGTGMTYQNAQTARLDLIDFGALPFIGCIEQTLGGPNVVPNGQFIRLDTNAWLRNPFSEGQSKPTDIEQAYNPPAQPPANGQDQPQEAMQ